VSLAFREAGNELPNADDGPHAKDHSRIRHGHLLSFLLAQALSLGSLILPSKKIDRALDPIGSFAPRCIESWPYAIGASE